MIPIFQNIYFKKNYVENILENVTQRRKKEKIKLENGEILKGNISYNFNTFLKNTSLKCIFSILFLLNKNIKNIP